jgi:hypothetical protein
MTLTWKWTPPSYVSVNRNDWILLVTASLQIYRTRVSAEEMRTGVHRPDKDLPFYEALNDPDTRAEYIRRASVFDSSRSFETNGPMMTQTSKCCNGGARAL